ncbi:hypothetical protein NQ317_003379 [Molorchus minor]|uniref:Protein kinase C-binding protein NELL2 n=1 Tax=Molorchus minor TaxID=1323400 RepID=A0ABQ9K7H7_9CUCU|nr:hypothetical protein NQ317_003379 [Molorchus minor]
MASGDPGSVGKLSTIRSNRKLKCTARKLISTLDFDVASLEKLLQATEGFVAVMSARVVKCVVSTYNSVRKTTGIDPTGLFSIPSPGQSIDLLGALGLYNSSWAGVTLTEGPSPQLRPAYLLQGDYRDLKLPPSAFHQVADLLRSNPEFTISARLKQEPGNAGTIVSFAHASNRFLELQSSGRKNEIRLHYTSRLDSTVHVETFRYRLADNRWHDLAVSVSGSQVELLVDCESLFKRLLKPGVPERNFSEPTQLWVGQRPGQRNIHFYYFKGAMQDVRLIGGPHGYLSSCPHLDSTCPTCGQFFLLQNTVQELTRHLQELSERLTTAEKRLEKVEECDCQKSCHMNGTVHADGATWQSGCELCACVHGEVKCRPVECPEPPCKHPVNKTGECCQSCLKHCFFHGQFFDHGEIVTVKRCVDCQCNDGSMKCIKTNPETNCPKLTCPRSSSSVCQITAASSVQVLTTVQKGISVTLMQPALTYKLPMLANAIRAFKETEELVLTPYRLIITSKHLQVSNRILAVLDIDECRQEGGLEGHHCNQNTKCLNTHGSYTCECLPGYRRVDKFNCAELDECSSGEHNCDVNAECINTKGVTNAGAWRGMPAMDTNVNVTVCKQSCLNGGICRSPGKCACPNGYTGPSCERDLDECATNSHRCTNASACVNMMGWYYCQCKEGYENPT